MTRLLIVLLTLTFSCSCDISSQSKSSPSNELSQLTERKVHHFSNRRIYEIGYLDCGDLIVFDGSTASPSVCLFSMDTKCYKVLSKQGPGPEELRGPLSFSFDKNTIYVHEHRLRETKLLSKAGLVGIINHKLHAVSSVKFGNIMILACMVTSRIDKKKSNLVYRLLLDENHLTLQIEPHYLKPLTSDAAFDTLSSAFVKLLKMSDEYFYRIPLIGAKHIEVMDKQCNLIRTIPIPNEFAKSIPDEPQGLLGIAPMHLLFVQDVCVDEEGNLHILNGITIEDGRLRKGKEIYVIDSMGSVLKHFRLNQCYSHLALRKDDAYICLNDEGELFELTPSK